MKNTIKRHLISFAVTFVASFCIFIYPAIQAGEWQISILVAAVFAAARSAFKVGWELALLPLMNWLIEWAKNYQK